jgi:hypothetical protein
LVLPGTISEHVFPPIIFASFILSRLSHFPHIFNHQLINPPAHRHDQGIRSPPGLSQPDQPFLQQLDS